MGCRNTMSNLLEKLENSSTSIGTTALGLSAPLLLKCEITSLNISEILQVTMCSKTRLVHGVDRPECVGFVQTFKFCLFIVCFMLRFYS